MAPPTLRSPKRVLAAERGAALYETFAHTGIVTVFPGLDVQILTGDGIVYTIGNHDPLTSHLFDHGPGAFLRGPRAERRCPGSQCHRTRWQAIIAE